VARFEPIAHVMNGIIYAFGGFKDNEWRVLRTYTSYDASTNTWKDLGTLPVGMAETHVATADDGHYIYFAGGLAGDFDTTKVPSQVPDDKVWRWDPTTNIWTQIATLPYARAAGGLADINGKLHYFGGTQWDNNLPDHVVLDLSNIAAGWTNAAPMPNPKDHFSTIVLNGKIYAVGGEHGHHTLHEQQADMSVYDPATDTWTSLAPMPIARSHSEGGTFLLNGDIVFAGGQVDNFASTKEVWAYDPNANAWTQLMDLPDYRQGAIIAPIGNKLVVTLGSYATDAPQSLTWVGLLPASDPLARSLAVASTAPSTTSTANGAVIGKSIYSVDTDGSILVHDLATSLTRLASPASARALLATGAAVAAFGRKLYLFGGAGAAGKVQIYDTRTNRWHRGRAMPFASVGGAAAVSVGGHIFVAGGMVAGQATNQVARYDPRTNRWSKLPASPIARSVASASTDGVRLFLSAGMDDALDPSADGPNTNTVQIYDPKTHTWQTETAPAPYA
jgi:N-acetylneuraminic acid mutarotase